MKDNAFRLGLLLCWLPWAAIGQPIIMDNFMITRGMNQASAPELIPEPVSDVVEFADGSSLHGKMGGMDVEHGLTWVSPEARDPIIFRPDHLDLIRFAHTHAMSLRPTCHLWFGNGDDLYGSISSLDSEKVGFNTWFGGPMVIPRAALRAITFLSPHYAVMYDGPYDEGGWTVVNNTPSSWSFRDGAFVGTGPGMLGRDMNLTNSTTVEFDLSWNALFSLSVCIYGDVTERLEVNGGSCVVDISPNRFNLRPIQNRGIAYNNAGVPIAEGETKNRMSVAIECNRAENTVSVFINHALAKTWKDCNFTSTGTGAMFMLQPIMFGNSTVKLSHIKISQWEGRSEPESFAAVTTNDAVHFLNHDQAAGNIESIQDGKAKLNLAGTVLDIPLERVTQIEFADAKPMVDSPGPWQVRAHFPGGGSVSFQLEKWAESAVSGRSSIFGTLAFQPNAIRALEFNLNQPRAESVAGDTKEFEGLDE